MQTLVMSTLSSDTHRPSGVKLWHNPDDKAFPSLPFWAARDDPDDVHATSYFAASARISSLVIKSITYTCSS